MEVTTREKGYGRFMKWLIKLGDIFVINIFFAWVYLFFNKVLVSGIILEKAGIGEMFLLINLSYFIASSLIDDDVSLNIVFFDKLLQKTTAFISLYTLLLIVGTTLMDVIEISWSSWLIIYLCLCIIYIFWHILLRTMLKLYRKKGYNYKRVVIVGGGLNGLNVYNELASNVYGFKVLGFFDDNLYAKKIPSAHLGDLTGVEQYCIEQNVDEIYCTLPGSEEAKIVSLMNFSEKNVIRFYLVPEFYKYIKRKLILSFLQSTPVVAMREEPLHLLHNRIIKRVFDIVFSTLILLTVFPLCYVVFGIIIKLTSPGPILFKQKRTGLGGEIFDCYKFRSMNVNPDAHLKIATKDDDRVTKIGQFMRKTSIDEIPQFVNVILGDMSVVGPRPHMLQQTELYLKLIDKFMIRHLVKPGITGWAQISGYRGETDTIDKMEGRFKRDVWYIENWSFVLDLKIIFVTVVNLFKDETEAY